MLAEIHRAGVEKAAEAGIDVVGGHTIRADEPIDGLSGTGIVHPERIVTNARAPAGLARPHQAIGVGIVGTAAENDADSEHAIDEAVPLMSTLNRDACEAMLEIGVSAARTLPASVCSGTCGTFSPPAAHPPHCGSMTYPFCPRPVLTCAAASHPGAPARTIVFLAASVEYGPGVPIEDQLLFADVQTSGGLLIAVQEEKAPELVAALVRRNTLAAAIVGRVEDGTPGAIRVSRSR